MRAKLLSKCWHCPLGTFVVMAGERVVTQNWNRMRRKKERVVPRKGNSNISNLMDTKGGAFL